jgi:hypothetical protein
MGSLLTIRSTVLSGAASRMMSTSDPAGQWLPWPVIFKELPSSRISVEQHFAFGSVAFTGPLYTRIRFPKDRISHR